ncbi:MAG: respiratory nitrate reductase subunit gamma [Alphaproteobacteria bacterium]|nr:respiratory nitrate reductase subunit gamma [Alphaproteobacteria bacterium]
MLFKLLFEFYAYFCILIFLFGSIYKVTASVIYAQRPLDNNIAKYINIGIITLVFLHFAVYFAAREIFLLAGISGNLQNKANMISGLVITIFLTCLVIVVGRKYFKNQLSFKGGLAEKLVSFIIILHIFLGFAAIGASVSLEDKALKNLSFSKYFTALFSFKENPSKYLENLKWLTLSHLLLGYSLLAVLPFTKLINIIVYKIKKICLVIFNIQKTIDNK